MTKVILKNPRHETKQIRSIEPCHLRKRKLHSMTKSSFFPKNNNNNNVYITSPKHFIYAGLGQPGLRASARFCFQPACCRPGEWVAWCFAAVCLSLTLFVSFSLLFSAVFFASRRLGLWYAIVRHTPIIFFPAHFPRCPFFWPSSALLAKHRCRPAVISLCHSGPPIRPAPPSANFVLRTAQSRSGFFVVIICRTMEISSSCRPMENELLSTDGVTFAQAQQQQPQQPSFPENSSWYPAAHQEYPEWSEDSSQSSMSSASTQDTTDGYPGPQHAVYYDQVNGRGEKSGRLGSSNCCRVLMPFLVFLGLLV